MPLRALLRALFIPTLSGLLLLGAAHAGASDPTDSDGTLKKADALSAATFDLPEPHIEKLRIAIVAFVRPSPFEAVVEPTLRSLEARLGRGRLDVRQMTLPELERAIRAGEVDVFLASSGFFLRMIPAGARSLASVVTRDYPNPNESEGSVFLVRSDRADLRTLADLKGRVLATSSPSGFTGHHVPMGEVLRAGFDPETFFGAVRYLGGGIRVQGALDLLRSGEADVANVRLCFHEEWLRTHPEDAGRFRVLHRKDSENREACARSTDLYPSWTIATTSATHPDVSRLVTQVLLSMPPSGENGLYWGVATDFASVDALFRDLRVGPYAYLRERTVRRFLTEYREGITLALLAALGVLLHSLVVSRLVRIRTRELEEALHEQRRLEGEARRAGERLERLERFGVVGELSTLFAHEMRQPLGALSLYTLALRKFARAGSIPGGKAAEIAGHLERQTERANAIVTRVRQYAKRRNAKREPVRLPEIVLRAVADLSAAGRHRARIDIRRTDDAVVEADALEIELVAVNLIRNALESLDAHPEVSDPHVSVSVLAEDGTAALVVADNGPTLTSERLRELADGAPSTKAEGLGLGLSIVRGIVENHGGRIRFERGPDGGPAARVELPLGKNRPEGSAGAPSETSSPTTSEKDRPTCTREN